MFAVWIWICNWRSREMKKARKSKKTTKYFPHVVMNKLTDQYPECDMPPVTMTPVSHVTRDMTLPPLSSSVITHILHWGDETREYNSGTWTWDYCALYKSGAVEDKIFMTMFSYAGSLWTPRNINQEILIWLRLGFCELLDITREREMTSDAGMRPCLSWLGSCILL